MPEVTYINLNGKHFNKNEAVLYTSNRAFLYGDGIFETIHANGTSLQFFDDHYDRMIRGMETLKMGIDLKFNKEKLIKNITGLLNKNKFYKGTRVRLTVFRSGGGLYTPAADEAEYLIEATPLPEDIYTINTKGLTIGIYGDLKKPINKLSKLKTLNALPSILAGLYKKENNLDDCLIVNEENKIIESISSNIFIVKGNNIYTPSIEDGCVEGVMRKQIINIAMTFGLRVFDDCSIFEEYLLSADEIFLSNAISGIKWVVAYKQRRYFNNTAKRITSSLNKLAFNSA